MNNIISKTVNGQVFRCSSCNKIHIEFKNFNFNFNDKQYKYFVDYILSLDGEDCEYRNRHSSFKRKVVLDIGHINMKILLTTHELEEFKKLLGAEPKSSFENSILYDDSFNIMSFLN